MDTQDNGDHGDAHAERPDVGIRRERYEELLHYERIAKRGAPRNAGAETVCQEAQRLVGGDRQEAYGHPLDNYELTAKFWSVVLGMEVTPEQVVRCMVCTKLARQMHRPKRDTLVDIAGYAQAEQMIHDERARRAHPQQSLMPQAEIRKTPAEPLRPSFYAEP